MVIPNFQSSADISLVELNQAMLSLLQCTAAAEALGADQAELLVAVPVLDLSTPMNRSA